MIYPRKTTPQSACFHILTFLLVASVLSGCAGPIGVARLSPQDSYRYSTDNALGAGKMSDSTKTVLQRYNLLATLAEDSLKTIQTLHNISKTDDRRDILFALSELSYLKGGKMLTVHTNDNGRQAQDMFLQSAVYAYFYLLGDGREPPPTAYDSRFREACDLYNRSLWQAFPVNDDKSLHLSDGVRNLPAGKLPLSIRTDTLAWKFDNFEGFFPSDEYAVRGFIVRDRTPGLGMPLVGLTKISNESPNGGALPFTAILRMSGNLRDYQQGKSQAFLEMYSALDSAEVQINDRSVPLETDITTPLAYKLSGSKLWNVGVTRFITGAGVPVRVLLIQPYEPGRIPVVFVHGTASSPAWWAEMLNSLRADPEIRKNFQFWFYQYNSSNLVTLSAAELRETLIEKVAQLDPQRKDPALQKMVVIGHSQGGLLTKMTVVDPGENLWNAVSDQSFDEIALEPEMRDFAQRLLLYKPLPFVKRVVFISTPHRGSYLTKDWVRALVRKVVNLPVNMVVNSQELLNTLNTKLNLPSSLKGNIPTSIDGMSEENPLLKGLVALPLEPGVVGHSIIAVKPGMDIATGNDGVVEYKSAHIDGMESEFIVRSEHSCQSHPFTIEEVRRILLKHIGIYTAWQAPAEKPPAPSVSLSPNQAQPEISTVK
jgi:pimeloyl-ACP methyl ester carboxylesterase